MLRLIVMAPRYPDFIDNFIQSAIAEIHPTRIILFGSRARGDSQERSDYDIAIDAPEIDEGKWARFVVYTKENLSTLLSVDIVRMDNASNELKTRIEKEGVLLYEKHNPAAT